MSRISALLTAIRALPPSPFRSGGAPQLSDALEAIVGRSLALPSLEAGVVQAREASLSAVQTRAVEGAEGAVRRIGEAAALKEFPVSNALLHPAHDPHYYTRMRDGVHRSAQGIGRSWWKRFFQVRGQA